MARRGIKKRDYEKLDDPTVSRVISLLNDKEKPITKTEACKILNISYNTSRLAKIIEEYKDKIEYAKKRRAQNRGKPFSEYEVKDIVISYLKGEGVTNIANRLFRSLNSVQKVLEDNKVPTRKAKGSYAKPELIPEENMSEEFSDGELVWSARYNCVAEVIKLRQVSPVHGNVYQLWVYGQTMEFANQPAYELGKMSILKTLGISGEDVQITDRLDIMEKIA